MEDKMAPASHLVARPSRKKRLRTESSRSSYAAGKNEEQEQKQAVWTVVGKCHIQQRAQKMLEIEPKVRIGAPIGFQEKTGAERDPERRKARAAALARQFQSDENAAFVDVAKHPRKEVFAVAVIRASTGELIIAGRVRAKTPGQAEEAAMYVG
ncbi:hypothetical protein MRX96_010701 [Rhipicephalus microplus]